MAKTCAGSYRGVTWKGSWAYADGLLSISPDGGQPIAIEIKEISAISGDGLAIILTVGHELLTIERLGADGPTLLDRLKREWLPARARALRLSGPGEAKTFTGTIQLPEGQVPFSAALLEDVLLVAPEGRDLRPLFLSLVDGVTFDETAYRVVVTAWTGESWTFGKLAGQTDEFCSDVAGGRDRLIREAAVTLQENLPTLSPASRASLAGTWPPGRILALDKLERIAAGFGVAFEESWLKRCLRRKEGLALRGWADQGGIYFAHCRPNASKALPEANEDAFSETENTTEPLAGAPDAENEARAALYMLARKGRVWLLENLSEKGHATYCFHGGEEIPRMASEMHCAPQFSLESLSMPIESMSGERADCAIAARDLPFLRGLRERFMRRVIHSASWKTDIASL